MSLDFFFYMKFTLSQLFPYFVAVYYGIKIKNFTDVFLLMYSYPSITFTLPDLLYQHLEA